MKQVMGENYDYKKNMLAKWAGIRPLVKELSSDRKD